MRLSIVTTMYHSAPYLREFHARAGAAARGVAGDDYELVFVNDGSPDDSLDVALALLDADPHVRVIDLSRNFGHHKAMMTGLAYSRGDLVLLLDSDLEESPDLLPEFQAAMTQQRADVVYGVRSHREGSAWSRSMAALYYKTFSFFSGQLVPANIVTMRLMTRRYVRALIRHREREVVMAGLWAITGFKQIPLPMPKAVKGSSTYTLPRKLSMLVNSITGFSNRPLIYVFYLGCIISALATVGVADLLIRRLFFGGMLIGWPSLIVSIWLLGGLNIFCIGILGIYLSKVFVETKRRPYTIVRDVYERKER
jgi:putative glycosyltransferase